MRKKTLTIEEKRRWLAAIFRDELGESTNAEKFKALAEDTRLALLEEEKEAKSVGKGKSLFSEDILHCLPPPEDV